MVDGFLSIIPPRVQRTLRNLLSNFEVLGDDTQANLETIATVLGEQIKNN